MHGLNFNIMEIALYKLKASPLSWCACRARSGIFIQEGPLPAADFTSVGNALPVSRLNTAEKPAGKVSSNYWSSSTNVNNTSNAWQVNFNNGSVNNNNKTNNNYIRCVSGAW